YRKNCLCYNGIKLSDIKGRHIMSDKKFLDGVNPERREFLEKVTKGAFIIPTVISIMMLNQKLNLTTANAMSNDDVPPCLSAETLISTPDGNVSIIDLRPGMLVITLDLNGNKVARPIELVSKAMVPGDHSLCHLTLDDGRELFVSPGHPTADAREAGDLNPGDILDGAEVVSIEKVQYEAGHTYDLLPSGETGLYFANGIPMGSTLSPDSKFFIRKLVSTESELYSG
ncbi:MAG: Hint domain-containing protein, partial [Candidatus Dadabacteria bacterium]|nr:Hint domain-containing protein [Candidatus Dadabacteria bacterium]